MQQVLGVDIDGMRRAWLRGDSPSLRRRRALARLSAVGIADFALISLYQLGAIRRMPDPPGRLFDSDQVNAARKAYLFGMPDGPLGVTLYAGVMAVSAFGGTRRTGRPRFLSWGLVALAAGGALSAVDYLRDMFFVQKKVCPWCLTGAAINLAMVPLAVAEARDGHRAQ